MNKLSSKSNKDRGHLMTEQVNKRIDDLEEIFKIILVVIFMLGGFYFIGWIFIVGGESIKFLMEDNKRKVDNLDKPKKKRKK